MTDDSHALTILDPGADSHLLFEALSRQKEGSGVERYVWESSNFPDDVASTLVFLREEVRHFVMKEPVDRIPLYSVNLTILRTSPRRLLALLGETKSFDRITRPQKMLQNVI